MNNLTEKISAYVIDLLNKELSAKLHFHRVRHTIDVVEAVTEIGAHSDVTAGEMDILKAAAWFHDTGYIRWYMGHEAESGILASEFLRQQDCPPDFISGVLECIHATMAPQKPTTMLQKIICDADLYHFTRSAYPDYAEALRNEFDSFLGKKYSDLEWRDHNLEMLQAHEYFTVYGKRILSRFKRINEERLKQSITSGNTYTER